MYRRDLITAEIQKLAQVLARIMGLKLEGKLSEADDLMEESLIKEFGLMPEDLFIRSNTEFEELITEHAFPAEKLEMLSQFLYAQFEATQHSDRNDALAQKLMVVYRILEVQHRIVSMTNLDRQKIISQYLKN